MTLRAFSGILSTALVVGTLLSTAPAFASPNARRDSSYPAYEVCLKDKFYADARRLTPREYERLRAAGFKPQEIYLAANAS